MGYKWWLLIAAGLFCIGIVLGIAVFFGISATSGFDAVLEELLASVEELVANITPFEFTTAVFIFGNNVITLLASFALSPFLCVMPVLVLLLNGGLLAFVSGVAVQYKSIGFVLAALLPHGIIEIPALIIGEAAALSFGVMVLGALFSAAKRPQLLPNLKQNVKYLGVACILLVPAAIIETYVTPLFLQ